MPPPIANPYQSCYSNSYASFQVPSAMEGCSCHKEQHGGKLDRRMLGYRGRIRTEPYISRARYGPEME